MEATESLPRMTRERLSTLVLSPNPPPYAIIDVRDDDHLGGHIHTSMHVPSRSIDAQLPYLLRTLVDKEIVVFHCALSQQRGPTAALRYLRERAREVEKRDGRKAKVEEVRSAEGVVRGTEGGEDWEGWGDEKKAEGRVKGQEVYVLDGGFVKWQEKYGRDERLTDSFAPDIWVDYY